MADHEHGEAITPEGVNRSHYDASRSYLTTSRVLGLVGLAAVGTGITLVVVGEKREPQVSVTTGVGQIALSGTF
jgi:hypothetical protein